MSSSSGVKGLPVLLVEDDEDVRMSLVQVLEDEGYSVSVAQNGRAALSLLHAADAPLPRVILLDILMPVMDGWDFLEEQARDAVLARIPVLILSASGSAREAAPPAVLSTSVLRKPFPLERLLSVVANLCARPLGVS